MSDSVNLKTLFNAGIHFGHLTRFREPAMNSYIYGERHNIHIIDLQQTLPLFNAAMDFVAETARRGGRILFVGTKRSAQKLVEDYAKSVNMPYVNYRWLGGMLTNYKTIRQSVKRLDKLKKITEDGTVDLMTKKERLNVSRTLGKLENSLGGIKDMVGLPDMLFVIDVGYEDIAIKEANRLKIPVVGVVDTNSNPAGVDYIIPGNDDSKRAIELYLKSATDKIAAAQQLCQTQSVGMDNNSGSTVIEEKVSE